MSEPNFTARQLGLPPMLDVETRIVRRRPLPKAERDATVALGPQERCSYALRNFCASQEIWTAWSGEEMLIFGKDCRSLRTPLFPHAEFAALEFQASGIENVEFVPIPLDDFIDEIAPQLGRTFAVDVFPGAGDVIRISTADFILDLRGAWEHFHGHELTLDPEIAAAYRARAVHLINGRMRRQMRAAKTGYRD